MVSPVSHLAVDPHGPLCRLGHRGCMTAYVTSGAMRQAVAQAHGRPVTYDDVLRLARDGDPAASRVVEEAAYALGRAVGAVSSLTGVERVILSGEGIQVAELAGAALSRGRLEYAAGHPSLIDPIIRPMDFAEWARGAAVVAIQRLFP
jgi:predicted NBD/HSP70 family sugar kinase